MSEANNVHPSEVGLAVPPELSKKEQAKLANILGFFRDAAEAVFPVQGFEVMTDPARNVLLERLIALRPGTLVAQRARLEADPHFRHPIPYILIHRQRPDGSLEFFVYQRTKLIGEELLGQKFSLALGGHPEVPCIRFDADAQFDTEQSLMACLVQELDEEATFNGQTFSDYTEAGGLYTYSHDGFIRDDSDKVGLQHIGIVYVIGLPMDVEVACAEEELITVGFRTLEELSADMELPLENSLYDFENWSRLVIRSYVERVEAIQAAEAVDAMFLAECGQEASVELEPGAELINPEGVDLPELPAADGSAPELGLAPLNDGAAVPLGLAKPGDAVAVPLGVAVAGMGGITNAVLHDAPEDVIGRGMTKAVLIMDEELLLGEEPDADQTWRQDQLEIAESGIIMCDPEDLPEIGEVTEEHRARHRAEGVALEDLKLPEGASLFSRGELVFISDTIEHPWEGVKALHAHILPSDKDPIGTLAQVKAGLLEQWMDPLNIQGMTRGEDGVLYFTVDPQDPDPQVTLKFLTDAFKQTVKAAPTTVDTTEFAKEVIAQITSAEVDPSADTTVLTELHREVGTTDAQMQVAVSELVRISDEAQTPVVE